MGNTSTTYDPFNDLNLSTLKAQMGNTSTTYDPFNDLSLSTLTAQLNAQLKQTESEIQTSQDFQRFVSGTMEGLIGDQQNAQLSARDKYMSVIQPAFMNALGMTQTMSAEMAGGVEERLAADPARQTAVGTIRDAASGVDISAFDSRLAEAAAMRGEAGISAGSLRQGLVSEIQGTAAPMAYQMELADVVRPFQNQAAYAGVMATTAKNDAIMLGAEAQSLAGLTALETSDISTLASLYGVSAPAFKDSSQSSDVVNALFSDYGYTNPLSVYGL
jgi:hypothetical protein